MATEKRQYPRVEIAWPVTMVTETGPVTGTIRNLSLSGTLIQCSTVPDLLYSFHLVFKPNERQQIQATAQRIWSETYVDDTSLFYTMGVCFTYIPEHDLELMTEAISGHLDQKTKSNG